MNNRKFLFLSLFTIAIVSCNSQNNVISSVTAKYVNANISTPIQIKCEEFEKSFTTIQMHEKSISDKDIFLTIEQILAKIKYLKDTSSMDVRTKVYVYYSRDNKQKIICMNKFNDISIDGILIAEDKSLIDLLHSFLK